MTALTALAADKMIQYYSGDIRRIEHFIKVHGYAAAIGKLEKLDDRTQETLEIAALLHDIGIKVSEEKYNSSAGKYQEIEGPPEAEKLLAGICCDADMTERICWLIAHHHTYSDIREIDHQILVEADFLVNLSEEHASFDTVLHTLNNTFRTESGKRFLRSIWNIN